MFISSESLFTWGTASLGHHRCSIRNLLSTNYIPSAFWGKNAPGISEGKNSRKPFKSGWQPAAADLQLISGVICKHNFANTSLHNSMKLPPRSDMKCSKRSPKNAVACPTRYTLHVPLSTQPHESCPGSDYLSGTRGFSGHVNCISHYRAIQSFLLEFIAPVWTIRGDYWMGTFGWHAWTSEQDEIAWRLERL